MATVTTDKVLRYTVNGTTVVGDLKALAAALKTDLRVVNNGIGRGEAWGVPFNDVRLEVEDRNEAAAIVKITDITGSLIYEIRAEGGQAIWNGYSFDGRRASTGVYLVFIAGDDGSNKEVTKILFVN